MLLLFVTILSVSPAFAGLKWADIGINGLTCSLCSRSVEMSLRRLDFVEDVVMSLETTEGRIFFKSGVLIDPVQIARAVVRAGFSVRFLKLQIRFDDIEVSSDGSFVFQSQRFLWIDYAKEVRGPVTLQLVDEDFLPRKESAQWKKKVTVLGPHDQKIFHVVQHG